MAEKCVLPLMVKKQGDGFLYFWNRKFKSIHKTIKTLQK